MLPRLTTVATIRGGSLVASDQLCNWIQRRCGYRYPVIDHLVYATKDVDASVHDLARLLGVEATAGGRHLGYGTRNAVLSLGEGCYLEIIGPDSGQPPPVKGYWYGVGNIEQPRLVTWTARVERIERVAAHAHAAGYKAGDVHKVFRETPDGHRLSWRLTLPTGAGDGLVPNLIEWDEGCPHPSDISPTGVTLVELTGYHPSPESITLMLKALRIDLDVRVGVEPRLVALLETPYGPVELS